MSNDQFSPEDRAYQAGGHRDDARQLSCAEIDALLPAYAIGATDVAETAVIRAHLQLCPIHAAELAKSGTLTQGLLFSAGEMQPPVRIANQLRRQLDQPLARTRPQVTPATVAKPWWQAWRWSAMWSAAAASLILILGALNLYWVRQNLELRQAYTVLSTQQATQGAEQQAVHELVTSEGIQFLELATTPAGNEETHAEVMWNPRLNTALLYAESFPHLPADGVYQLWLTYEGERRSGGLFQVDGQGNGVLIFAVPHPLDQAEVIGITPEPAGGSAKPTSDPVVRWKF